MINGIIRLAVSGIFTILLTVALYRCEENHIEYRAEKRRMWQIVIGLIYGVLAVCGTEFGVSIEGAVMNIRDAAPLCAGLFFGAPAGIIAGFIGGIERWFAVYWGAGEYTRLACTIGTIAAGLFGAFVRKNMLEDRRPRWIYAMVIGLVTEVFHILMVFLTNMGDAANAIVVAKACTPVMIPLVALTVGGTGLLISVLRKEKFRVPHEKRRIVEDIQAGLLITVLITFVLTNMFVIIIQNHMVQTIASDTIGRSLEDIRSDADKSGTEGDELLQILKENVKCCNIGTHGYACVLNGKEEVLAITEKSARMNDPDGRYTVPEIVDMNEGDVYVMNIEGWDADCYVSYIKVSDYYVVGIYPSIETDLIRSVSIYTTALFEIIIMAALFLQIFFMIRRVVVNKMQAVNDDLSRISSGDLDVKVDIDSNREFALLSKDINATVDTLKQYIDEASARIDAELSFARDIQYSALPRVYPENSRIDLYANMLAAKEVGGDFYDFYPVMGDKIALLIADVSGKGIPAALFMMKAQTLIKSLVESGAAPEVAFTKANEELCRNNEAGMFLTAWLGIMDLETGVIRYANAGHNPPIVIRAKETLDFEESKPGFVLAGLEGINYKGYEFTLEKGDTLYMYTDGVTEATDAENRLYGEKRLYDALRRAAGMNTRYLCKSIKEDIDGFVGDAPQFDDITMLAVTRKSDDDVDGSVTVKPDRNSIVTVENYFKTFNSENGITQSLSAKIMVIVDELYSNIVNYSGATWAKVKSHLDGDRVIITLEDNGIAYDPLKKKDPDITLPIEERAIGGLGIFMVKQMSEDLKYSRINGNNIVDVVLKADTIEKKEG